MNQRSQLLRLVLCTFASLIATGSIGVSLTSCSPDDAPIEPVAGKPLPQDGRIAVEIPINNEYKTVHITRHALEDLAARYCAVQRRDTSDSRLCGGSYYATMAGISASDENAAVGVIQGSANICTDALCFERNEVCAGYFIEEIAKSPSAREVVDSGGGAGAGGGDPLIRLDRLELKPSEAMALGLAVDPGTAAYTSFPKIRFQPLAAPGKAAAFRGAMNRFRRSTVVADYMRKSITVVTPTQASCLSQFQTRDGNAQPTPFNLVNGVAPGWTDTFVETFIDGSTQYTVLLPETVAAMQSSAEFQVRGRASDLDEVETQWNGSYDSVTAIGKFLAFGEDTPIAAGMQGGDHIMAQSGGLMPMGPTGAPTCPPVPSTTGGNAALTWSKLLKISPAVVVALPAQTTYETALVWAYNEDLYNQGFITTPYDNATVLKRINTSSKEVAAAGTYLTALEKKNGTKVVFDAATPTLPSGFHHVPRLLSTPKTVSTGMISASFLGPISQNQNMQPSSKGYSQHGVIAAIDQIKMTAQAIKTGVSSSSYVKAPIKESVDAVVEEAKVFVGSQRVEFLFGVQPSNATDTMNQIRIYIHGVPALTTDKYAVVLGADGAKCVSSGNNTIDNVPCQPGDYLVSLPSAGSLDSRMTDLTGGTINSGDIPTLKLPGNATAPIPVPGWVFVVRQKSNTSKWDVVAGAETGASLNGFIDVSGYTRRLFAPIAEEGVSTLQQIMEDSQLASVDDCSRPQDSCAGLPVTMFPPLESEVNGDQSSLPYERSWKKYLDEARRTADVADQLGREVVQAGLAMDQRREAAIEQLRDLCGADADETSGCGLDPKENKTVTLGDAPVCMWVTKGQACKCKDGNNNPVDCTGALRHCPLVLRPELGYDATDDGCKDYISSIAGTQVVEKAIIVTDTLKLAKSQPRPPATAEPTCQVFDDLRTGNLRSYQVNNQTIKLPEDPTNRELIIREQLMPFWNRETVSALASGMRYREDFADNYQLTQDGAVIFKTRRPKVQVANAETLAPCHVGPLDTSTGSAFWSTQVGCYVSGQVCPLAVSGIGKDGCPTDPINGNFNSLSLDTEPAALQARWAWGFGNLRRSVATLGIVTGQLDGMMSLSHVWTGPFFEQAGYPLGGPTVIDREADWIFHGNPSSQGDLRPFTQCIALADGLAGPHGDTYRDFSGRPVNWNSWLLPASSVGTFGSHTIPAFPCADPDGAGAGTCAPIGLDPQMPYCAFTEAANSGGHYYANLGSPVTQVYDSGLNQYYYSPYVGTTRTSVARIHGQPSWSLAQSEMWEIPPPGFCVNPTDTTRKGAIWRAFCASPDPINASDPAYIHEGKAQTAPPVYYSRSDVSGWVAADADDPGAALFGVSSGQPFPKGFQYAVDRRNVYDALELACHAYDRPVTETVNCADALAQGYKPKSANEYVEALRCMATQVEHAVGSYVVDDVPQAVVDARQKNNGILSPGAGSGGQLYDEMANELTALQGVSDDYDHIQDSIRRLASIEDEINSIERESKGLDAQFLAQKRAAVAEKIAAAAQVLISATPSVKFGPGDAVRAGEAAVAIAALTAAAAFEQEALDAAQKVAQEQNYQKRINAFSRAYDQLAFARDSAKSLATHLNQFSAASKRVRLVVKKGTVAVNRAKFADYAGDDQTDPQYVNIVMRRSYNTALVRYLRALDRARKASFIARRAIELRFGVELQRMTSPMKLVDAPSTWATRVCTMGGIDYSKIRSPDSDTPVSGFDFGAPPLQGDDYASSFIGDYVSLLEDFVKSYPIDYPLKDGDDTAVISLKDDIFRSSSACTAPSKNVLYYSCEIDKRDEAKPALSTKGWFSRACATGSSPEFPGTNAWAGCVQSYVMGPPALAPDANGLNQGTTTDGVSLNGLPPGAIPYRLTNVPCVASGSVTCPSGTTNTALGSLAQVMTDLGSAYYVASVYAHLAPGSYAYASGNGAQIRVVRRSDNAVIASSTFAPTGADWEREEIVFVADAQESYRLELVPSIQQVTIAGPGDYSVWLAAAQVERITTKVQSSGSPNATGWQRTDELRTVPSNTCDDPNGVGLRRQFTRSCEYLCKGGVKKDCGNLSADGVPSVCFYEAKFAVPLEKIESGALIPTGQIAIGNFNFRHNELGLNVTGTGVTNCAGIPQQSCYDNGFIQYTLIHSGDVSIRNWTGASLVGHMDTAFIEHGKALAAERVVTNPPSGSDLGLMSPYMKGEYKGRPFEGLYTLRIYDSPSLRWDRVRDIQLVAKYHYWTRFSK